MKSELLTADDVAALLKRSKQWVLLQCYSGALPHIKIGERTYRFRPEQIRAWLEKHEQPGEKVC